MSVLWRCPFGSSSVWADSRSGPDGHLEDLWVGLRFVDRFAPLGVCGVDRSWVGTFVPSVLVYPLILMNFLPFFVSAMDIPPSGYQRREPWVGCLLIPSAACTARLIMSQTSHATVLLRRRQVMNGHRYASVFFVVKLSNDNRAYCSVCGER